MEQLPSKRRSNAGRVRYYRVGLSVGCGCRLEYRLESQQGPGLRDRPKLSSGPEPGWASETAEEQSRTGVGGLWKGNVCLGVGQIFDSTSLKAVIAGVAKSVNAGDLEA